jgi:pimeloyl-ACP methyl ester carboxylesterase
MSTVRSMWERPPNCWYQDVRMPVLLLNALPDTTSGAVQALAFWARCIQRWAASATEGMPHSESRWYPDTDHNLHLERPAEVAADMLEFAARIG